MGECPRHPRAAGRACTCGEGARVAAEIASLRAEIERLAAARDHSGNCSMWAADAMAGRYVPTMAEGIPVVQAGVALRAEVERLKSGVEIEHHERAVAEEQLDLFRAVNDRLERERDEARASLARVTGERDRLAAATVKEGAAAQRAEAECARLRAEGDEGRAAIVRLFDANVLAAEVQKLIDRKVIDSRSPAADALLDFVNPGPNESVPEKIARALRPSPAPAPTFASTPGPESEWHAAINAARAAAPVPKEDAPRCTMCRMFSGCAKADSDPTFARICDDYLPRSPASDAAPCGRCPECGGTGSMDANRVTVCRTCHGTGRSPSPTPTKEK